MPRDLPAGVRPPLSTKPAADGDVATEEETPFRHYVPGERPRSDGAFFEILLMRVVAQDGTLPNFEDQWPRGMQALAGLNLMRLSGLSVSEMAAAVATIGGELGSRLTPRVGALIAWAEAFWRVRQIYGSFRQYVRSFDNDGFDALLNDLSQRLPDLTPEFLTAYLREVGEKPPAPVTERAAPPPRRQQQPPPTPQAKPSGAKPAPAGGEERGRRRRRPRRGSQQTQKPQAAAATPEAKPAATTPEKPGTRNKRRFFRRRRGRGGSGAQGQGSAPSGNR